MDYARIGRTFNEIVRTVSVHHVLTDIRKIVKQNTFFPHLERKNAAHRTLDLLLWYFRHKEVNYYYHSYGFDIKHLRNQKDYLPYREFRITRNNDNLANPSAYSYTRVCILRDKVLFSSYLSKLLGGQYVPSDLGRLTPDGVVHSWDERTHSIQLPLADFLASQSGDLFIKKLTGECGESCYSLENLSPGDKTLAVNNLSMTMEEFSATLQGSEFIIQRRIAQHEQLSALNPSCVNTIRIVTVVGKHSKTPKIFAHFLRLGINSIVDNRATGGIAVLIDENGVLRGDGFGHTFICSEHPVTGQQFEGYALPYWEDVCQLVLSAHNALKDIPSIGWDVAITPTGPILLEGNDNWEICGVQDTMGGIKARWYEFRNQ